MAPKALTVELPVSVCAAAGMRESELPRYLMEGLAVELYRQRRISIAKAAEITGVTHHEAMALLTRHDAYLYDDAETDWHTLRERQPE